MMVELNIIEKLISERAELRVNILRARYAVLPDRRKKLNISESQKILIEEQTKHMVAYEQTLKERIIDLEKQSGVYE